MRRDSRLVVTKSTTGTADQATKASWRVGDIADEVALLRARGVQIQDLPELGTVDGIARHRARARGLGHRPSPQLDRNAHADHLDRCLNVEAASLLARPRPPRSAGAHPAQQLFRQPVTVACIRHHAAFDVLARTKIADPDARGDGSQLQITLIDR